MKWFLLFVGEHHYPVGGARDYCGSFTNLEEAEKAGEVYRSKYHGALWMHIVEMTDDGLVPVQFYGSNYAANDDYLNRTDDDKEYRWRSMIQWGSHCLFFAKEQ